MFCYQPFGPEFEESFLAGLKKHCNEQPLHNKIVIVPSHIVGLALRHRLASHIGHHNNVRFVRFVDLAKRVIEDQHDLEQLMPTFPPKAQQLLIKKLCSQLSQDHLFFPIREEEGLHLALARCFHELGHFEIKELPHENKKLTDLDSVYQGYQREILSKYQSSVEWIEKAAAQKIDARSLFSTPHWFIYGFSQFTPLEQSLLKACEGIEFHTWLIRDPLPSSLHLQSVDWVASTGGEPIKLSSAKKESPSTSIASYGNIEDESRSIVKAILDLARQGHALNQMAIFYPNSSSILPFLRRHLDRAGLPYYVDQGTPWMTTALGKGSYLWLELARHTFGRREWMNVVQNVPWNPTLNVLSTKAYWETWSIEHFWSSSEHFFSMEETCLKEESQKAWLLFQKQLHRELSELESALDHSFEKTALTLQHFWKKFFAPRAKSEEIAISTFVNQWKHLDRIPLPFDAHERRDLLLSMMESFSYSTQVFDEDGVYLCSTDQTPTISFDHLFLPCINDGIFPSKPKQDPLLSQHHRTIINQKMDRLLPMHGDHLIQEQNRFHHYGNQGRKNVFYSYTRLSFPDQNTLFISPFLETLHDQTIKKTHQTKMYSWNERSEIFLDDLDFQENCDSNLYYHPLQQNLCQNIDQWASSLLESSTWNAYDSNIEQKLPEKIIYSASQLSQFWTCPSKYFFRYHLKLAEKELPEDIDTLGSLDRGNLIHRTLFEFMQECRSKNQFPFFKQDFSFLMSTLDETLEKNAALLFSEGATGNEVLWNIELRQLRALLHAWLHQEREHQMQWNPTVMEMSFGMNIRDGSDPIHSREKSLDWNMEDQSYFFKGKVDRVDLSHDGTRMMIIDYKTGDHHEVKKALFEGGQLLQLPLYFQLLRQIFPQTNPETSEVAYAKLKLGHSPRLWPIEGQRIQEHRQQLQEFVRVSDQYIRKGHFFQHPGKDRAHCKICEYKTICSDNVERWFERKKHDPLLEDYLRLAEVD
ncbi:MAG: PD-(D/E)XK nuclease family protein [Bdellovibrionota bacterium]